jgi:hypothetical protein
MKETQRMSNLFDRYTSWHSKLTLPQKFALAYTTMGVSELVPYVNAKAIPLDRVKKVAKRVGFASIGFGALIVCASISHNVDQAQAPAKVSSAPAYTRWNNPNVKPFNESPWFSGGFNETVYWDATTKQWYCSVTENGATPCKEAEGKTTAQLAEDTAKLEAYQANREAEEAAKNDYWCGLFEDPQKTGCHSM